MLGADPVIGAFDEILAPLPGDAVKAEVTGYWRDTERGVLPPRVESFLTARGGVRPVYVGFGSMAYGATAASAASLAVALLRAGYRVVVGRGWSAACDDLQSDDCLVVDDVPHDLLFPRMCAVIHHGGAGTTAGAALAGAPQVVIPHLGDQFYHGARVEELGIGVKAIPLVRATPSEIVATVGRILGDAGISHAAGALAAALRGREGSAAAAELLEGYAGHEGRSG
jgi:sterol 3beta-glucosyltransferase